MSGKKEVEVESSTITKIEYLNEKELLIVSLKNGGQFQFSNVPVSVFHRFSASKDKFAFLKGQLIGVYPFRRIA